MSARSRIVPQLGITVVVLLSSMHGRFSLPVDLQIGVGAAQPVGNR